jgi:hypothetical protein
MSALTHARSSACDWYQNASEYTFGLMWREAVIAREAYTSCAAAVTGFKIAQGKRAAETMLVCGGHR